MRTPIALSRDDFAAKAATVARTEGTWTEEHPVRAFDLGFEWLSGSWQLAGRPAEFTFHTLDLTDDNTSPDAFGVVVLRDLESGRYCVAHVGPRRHLDEAERAARDGHGRRDADVALQMMRDA